MLTAKKIVDYLNLPVKHAMYNKNGNWYHHLKEFPGALIDPYGFVVFSNQKAYETHSSLQHGKHVHVIDSIEKIEGYRMFSAYEARIIHGELGDTTPEDTIRILRKIQAIQRNQQHAKDIKKLYENTCQICGERLKVGAGKYYSEVHHIKPLGEPHSGPDIKGNMICVCPNDHVLLDFQTIEIDINSLRQIDHQINSEFVKYHNNLVAAKKDI